MKEEAEDRGKISDGYHTFDELYEHRIVLFVTLCRFLSSDEHGPFPVWRSKLHSDGSSFDGWFVLGIWEQAGKQITYHLPIARWDECDFADVHDRAPEFDGHTSADVLKRLELL